MPAMDDESARRDKVADWIRREMDRQGITPTRLGTLAGMDLRTLNKLLAGGAVLRADRRAAVALALGFEGDSISRILDGQDPVPLETEGSDELRFRALERRVDRLEALIEDALQPPDRPTAE